MYQTETIDLYGKDFNQRFLHYGAIVTIRDYKHKSRFFQGDGFASDSLSISNTSGAHKDMFTRSLFMVLPKFSSDAKHQCQKVGAKMEGLNPQKMYEFVKEIEYNTLNEYLNNFDYCKKMTVEVVKYFSPIQLLHINSKKFLSVPIGFRAGEDPCPLTLSELPSDRTLFIFTNVYKYQTKGDCNVIFQSPVKLSYHRSLDKIHPSLNLLLPNDESKVPLVDMNEWTKLEINLYSNDFSEDGEYMRGGDIIWIRQLDYAKMLATKTEISKKYNRGEDIEDSNEKVKNLLSFKEMAGIDQEKLLSNDLELISIANSNSDDCLILRGMWIIENMDRTDGSPIRWDGRFRLLSLATQRYLTMRFNPYIKQKEVLFEETPSMYSTFSFESISSNESKYVLKNDYITLRHVKSRQVLKVTVERGKSILKMSNALSGENTIKISRCQESERIITYLEMSTSVFLNETFLDELERFQSERDFRRSHLYIPLMRQAFKVIQDLRKFLKNQILFSKFNEKYGVLNKSRQRFLYDQDYIKLMAVILNVLFAPNETKMLKEGAMETEFAKNQRMTIKNMQTSLQTKKFVPDSQLSYEEKRFYALASKVNYRDGEKGNEAEIMADIQYLASCKILLADEIYGLMTEICQGEQRHQLEAYQNFKLFIDHFRYLDSCRKFLAFLIQHNYRVSSDLQRNLNFKRIQRQMFDGNRVKIDLVIMDSSNKLVDDQKRIKYEIFKSRTEGIEVNQSETSLLILLIIYLIFTVSHLI